jgi:hypothetical protein
MKLSEYLETKKRHEAIEFKLYDFQLRLDFLENQLHIFILDQDYFKELAMSVANFDTWDELEAWLDGYGKGRINALSVIKKD